MRTNIFESKPKLFPQEVPIVPGTDGPITTKEDALEFCKQHGLPVIFKVKYNISYLCTDKLMIRLLYVLNKLGNL